MMYVVGSMTHLAPVVVTVFDRPGHLQRCLKSLAENPAAARTPVFLGIDGPADKNGMARFREVLAVANRFKSGNYFASLELVVSDFNIGSKANSRQIFAVCRKHYDRFIRLEDDVIVGKYFLEFMNDGLSEYEASEEVFAICGHVDLQERDRHVGPFLKGSFAPYGYASWFTQTDRVESESVARQVKGIISNRERLRAFFEEHESGGILPLIAFGDKKPGDFQKLFFIKEHSMYCLFPPASLAEHTGVDGTGEHAHRAKHQDSTSRPSNSQIPLRGLAAEYCRCVLPIQRTPAREVWSQLVILGVSMTSKSERIYRWYAAAFTSKLRWRRQLSHARLYLASRSLASRSALMERMFRSSPNRET